MTTRVNKRGTIFKPVAKAKSRGPSLPRQPSVPSDPNPNLNAGPSSHDFSFQTAPSASRDMPPPSSLPSDMSSSGHFSVLTFSSPVLPPTTPTTAPRPPQSRPLVTPQPPPPRTPSVPPLIASATPRKPTVITPSAPPTVAVAPPVISSSSALAFAIGESSTLGPSPSSTAPISARVDQPTEPSILVSTQPVETTQSNASVDSSSTSLPESLSENQPSHPKRKTARRSTTPQQDTPSQAPQHPKRRKRNPPSDGDTPTTNTRRRRATSPNLPKFNPEDGPGEELDPTTITMAALCSDTGQGRISSKAVEIQDNFVSWKSQSRQQRARMRELAELKKYGKITDDGEVDVPPSGNAVGSLSNTPGPTESQSLAGADSGDEENENNNEFDYSDNLPSNRFNVQVRIGPNGETIIDEESLVIDRDQDVDTSEYTHVVESDTSKFVNSGTYRKKCRGSRWSKEETELFYHALSQYGENYELLAFVLPGRDRTACKNKFKAEDKRNSARITYCLNNRIPVDISTLSRMTGKDFTGPCPEIRTPAPKAPPVALAPTTDAATSQKPSVKVKKRSRSRSMALNDDVQIIGSADTFVQEDD